MNIKEISSLENNKPVSGTFIITEITQKPFQEKEGYYLSFVLQDKTGKIQGKIWDNVEKFKIKDDTVIDISGNVNVFAGKNQIIVNSASKVTEYNLSDFLVTSKINVDEAFNELDNILSNVEDVNVKAIWNSYKNDEEFVKQFKVCPAGKGDVHHAYLHGLLEHSLFVVKLCDLYSRTISNVNRSILLMGAFLHDLGKLKAYDYAMAIKMTDVGRLHGHSVIGYHSFLNRIEKLDIEEEQKIELSKVLGHMILSHHGSHEQQAVIVPMTKEAMLLVDADSVDANTSHVAKFLENTKDSWTVYDNMRQRMYYKKQETKESTEVKKTISRKKPSLFEHNEG